PHNLSVLTALQHTLGLAIAAMLYALLVRLTVPRWVAVLASLPVLLDGYQLQLEHLVMSDVLYAFLTTAGVVALLWNERPSGRRAAGAGVLLGVAAVTRSIGLPVAAALLVVLVLRRVGLREVAAAGLACFLPVAAYGAWFHAEQGRWALTNSNGIFLYSRVMAFADCSSLELIPAERALCDPRPPQERPESSRYIWSASLPLGRLPGFTFTPEKDRLAQGFAVKAIRSQPLDYARQVARELSYNFSTSRVLMPVADIGKYEFVSDASKVVPGYARQRGLRTVQAYDQSVSSLDTASDPRLTRFLDRYQDVVRVPGPALVVLVVLALAAVVPVRPRTIRGPALALSAAAGALLVVPPMTAQFDHRYVLAAVPLLAAAAGLSATGIARAAGGGGRHSWGDGEQGLSA
ncbi:MAG: phospholipid carrier-dependent glycosyltransferase, partial [Chloroflexota bacterium]|nr:phospholipid carrier-dependent glycosyltransferase [Chloroflexota bacterium]